MKKSQILATLALALALGLTAPIASVFALEEGTDQENGIVVQDGGEDEGESTPAPQDDAPADDTPAPLVTDTVTVSNAADLQTAVNDNDIAKITIDTSFTVTTPITINRTANNYLTIDLGGKTISSDASANARIFVLENGDVSINNGTIDASASVGGIGIKVVGQDATYEDYGTLRNNLYIGFDTTIKAGSTDSAYGIAVYPKPGTHKAANTYVNLAGVIDATNGACGITVLGSITDTNNAPNVGVSGTITAGDTGIYNAGYSSISVYGEGAVVTGATGITTKAGYLYVGDGAVVKGTGAFTPVAGGAFLDNSGAAPTGAAIQIESNGAYAGNVSMTLADGTIESVNGPAIYGYGDRADHEAVASIVIVEGEYAPTLISGGAYVGKDLEGIPTSAVEYVSSNSGLGGDETEDKKTDTDKKAPGTGIVAEGETSAQKTASTMAAIATALTTVGAAVVARRQMLRSDKKN